MTAACALLIAGMGLASRPICADTVYRWTDARGVVHFSDVPPQGVRSQAETLPDRPAPVVQPPSEPAAAEPLVPPASGEEKDPSGPAQVVLTDQQAEPLGAAVRSFRGKVKNKGGVAARDVYVSVVVTEPVQGDECLREEIDVTPSTLAPGAEGSFEAAFESPCFHGETSANVQAAWR
jgi:Domain of unknown function (DUF4124)